MFKAILVPAVTEVTPKRREAVESELRGRANALQVLRYLNYRRPRLSFTHLYTPLRTFTHL